MNLVAICFNIFLPWFVFSAIYAVLSFSFHYQHPTAAWCVFGAGVVAVFISFAMWYRAKRKDKELTWYIFSTLALLLAVVLAGVIDDKLAMGFKNLDVYCVAPIVVGDAALASYDF